VLRKKIEAIQQPMQCHSRFSRAAWTHQQNSTTVKTYASGVQWHQTLGTGGEGEDRELDQLIASVVRKSQHLGGYGHDRRALPWRQNHGIRRHGRTAEKTCAM